MKLKGNVYFKNQLSGQIQKKEEDTFEFQYKDKSTEVSWTLPYKSEPYASENIFPFFDGLIPEGWLLNLAHKNWKIPKNDRMTLLLTTCMDCIGAAHIAPEEAATIADIATKDSPHQIKNTIKKSIDSNSNITKNEKFEPHRIPKLSSDRCLICLMDLTELENQYHSHCARELFGFNEVPKVDVSLNDLEALALIQINQRLTLTGVQKKLSLSESKENKHHRLTIVGMDGKFILKPPTSEYPEIAEIEHVSMKLAQLQKIKMARCGLIYLDSGERAYITRRFDRADKEKIQMEDFCQLSEKLTEKKYSGSSEALAKVIDKYSDQAPDDKLTLFQILLFSFWIGNADMHLKNFSLWKDPQSGNVRMSPGYDFLCTRLLISTKEDPEEMALPINGKKNKLQWQDFVALGMNYKIPLKVIERVREQMLDSFFDAEDLIARSFLTDAKKEEFMDLLRKRSKRLSK